MSERFKFITKDTNGQLKYYDQIIKIFLRLVPGCAEDIGQLILKMRDKEVRNPYPNHLTDDEFLALNKASKKATSRIHLTMRNK